LNDPADYSDDSEPIWMTRHENDGQDYLTNENG